MAEAARLAPAGETGATAGAVLAAALAGVVAGPSVFALSVGRLGSYAAAFAMLAVLALPGAGIPWRTDRRDADDSMAAANRVGRRSGVARRGWPANLRCAKAVRLVRLGSVTRRRARASGRPSGGASEKLPQRWCGRRLTGRAGGSARRSSALACLAPWRGALAASLRQRRSRQNVTWCRHRRFLRGPDAFRRGPAGRSLRAARQAARTPRRGARRSSRRRRCCRCRPSRPRRRGRG